jgi:hypothetical protein
VLTVMRRSELYRLLSPLNIPGYAGPRKDDSWVRQVKPLLAVPDPFDE